MKNKVLFIVFAVLLCSGCRKRPLVILFTNDTHSQVEFCDESTKQYGGLGGYVYRSALIDSIRDSGKEVLLFDAGDFFQGTPYFNLYKGRVELDAYNHMGYDAVTLGNHEFDNGLDSLAFRLREADFKIICTNYGFSGTPLNDIVDKYAVFCKVGLKIGVLGLCVNPEGLILDSHIKGVVYSDPIEKANTYARFLKKECHCDLVVVLSHLGTEYEDSELPSDVKLAENSTDIDIILGGHTHKQVNSYCRSLDNDSVLLMQTGKMGGFLGMIEINVQ